MPYIPDDPNDPNHGLPADPDKVGRVTVACLVLWVAMVSLSWWLLRP